jgi:hypothetical protein
MLEEAKKELEKIEYQNRTWKSKFIREQSIWDDIAEEINDCTGKKQKFWSLVMDLYHQKYTKSLS